MLKDIWIVTQVDEHGNRINMQSTAYSKEQDAIDEMNFKNEHETSEYKWDYEIFFLKD
jgi:hypothetical protein